MHVLLFLFFMNNVKCFLIRYMGVNNVYDENFFISCMWVPYYITYSISTNKLYVTRQIKEI